jgi:hypothetical protein
MQFIPNLMENSINAKRGYAYMISAPTLSLTKGALPVDPFEFALVLSLANQVFIKNSGKQLIGGPENGDGKQSEFVYQKILQELRDLYTEERPEKYMSICWRLFSLYKLIKAGELDEWVARGEDGLHTLPLPVVIFVAATLPLESKKGFNPRLFIGTVRECIASELYH